MKLRYYPGCTLKTKAANLELAALASLRALGLECEELERWNCCGAVFSLSTDDLIHHVAPVRNLIRAKEAGADAVVTLCSQCYNTLARANRLVQTDEEKRKTLNLFMDEEIDYAGEVKVLHFLELLRDEVGWERLRQKVKVPLTGLRAAPFYGCALVRPEEVSLLEPGGRILEELLEALGATVVDFPASTECCGAYQVIANPAAASTRAATVLAAAGRAGAETMVLSCPLCEYNLGGRQEEVRAAVPGTPAISTVYFTQLLAIALGLAETCRIDLNNEATKRLLRDRGQAAAQPA
jgi:heterodisulfide reductase subunit B2